MRDGDATEADLVLVDGRVQTMDAARSWAQAVAVRGGRVVAVGTDTSVRQHVGRRTEVIDLGGRMLLPGFQDAHIHPVSGGLNRLRVDLTDTEELDEYLARVRRYAREHPDEGWIAGAGWSMPTFPGGTPTADLLDEVVADRPVILRNRDGHGAWVNSRALELAGIDADTPDPRDGRIERHEDGAPTGTLHEGAVDLVRRLVPTPSTDRLVDGLLEAQRYLHGLGVTSWQDAIVGPIDTIEDTLPAYHAAVERGALTAKVVGALWWDRHRGMEQLDELIERRGSTPPGRFRPTAVKIMQDGVCENFTAAMLQPYLDEDGRPTAGDGLSFVEPDVLARAVTALDREGFQVHVHAIGDRAVREALDAFAAAREANGTSGNRHHIAHIQVIHPDDVSRFHELGVVANAQPYWAVHEPQMDELTIPFLGPQRASWQYRFADLLRSGATLCSGSDWPVSTPDPLALLHVAVNRVDPAAEAGTPALLPEQRLDLTTAIAAATIVAAHVNHHEDETGSIEVGKAADLVVVDRDLFTVPDDEIADARVEMTLVDGEVVAENPS